jgi:putative copper resistance protein D
MYPISVTIHVLAAMFWLGGMFFLAIVGAPALRGLDPDLRRRLFKEIGERFRSTSWVVIGILLVTGVSNLHFRGLLRPALTGGSAFWLGPTGIMLLWKLALVGAMLAIASLHDFWLGPRAGTLRPGSREHDQLRRTVVWLGRANALVGVLLVYVATRIVRG